MAAPRILVVDDTDELSRVAADVVAAVIEATPAAAIAVATGRTPIGLYAELAARRRSNLIDVPGIAVYQLDEYLGLEPFDRRSLFGWMQQSFLEPLGIEDERVNRLPVDGDLDDGCAAFDRELEAGGGLDLAILGLGPNGHLGFNEPPSGPDTPTRVVDLSPVTIEANARYWGDAADVPRTAVTMGMAQLLSARSIVLLASGEEKRSILHRALEGSIGPEVPASYLRETPGELTVIVDRAARSQG